MLAVTTGISSILTIVVAVYAFVAFFATLKDPRLGFYLLIPIIGLGFEETALLKGGMIAFVALGSIIHGLASGKSFTLSRETLSFLLIVLVFISWVLVRGALVGEEFRYWVEWIGKRLFVPGMLVPLAVFILRDEQSIVRALRVMVFFAVVTAFFGIMQYFFPEGFFWKAREVLGVPGPIAYQIIDRIRISGLSSYVIPLSYQLGSLVPVALAFFFMKKTLTRRAISFGVMVIISLALVLTFVKSAIGGAFFGAVLVFVMAYRSGRLKPWAPIPALIFVCIVFAVMTTHPKIRSEVFSIGTPSLERIPIALSAVNVITSHPLGVGYNYPNYVRESYADVAGYFGASIVTRHFPHNIVLNIAAILGIPALVLGIFAYFVLFRGLFRLSEDMGNLGMIATGLVGSFVAYIVNAMFHNNNPFFGDTFNWIIIGVSFAAMQVWVVSRKQSLVE